MASLDNRRNVASLLDGWTKGDHDQILRDDANVDADAKEIWEELREQEGDARRLMTKIEVEFEWQADQMRGALHLIRNAVELLLDPPGERPISREDALHLIVGEQSGQPNGRPGAA